MKHIVARGVVQYYYTKGDQMKWRHHKLTQRKSATNPYFCLSIFWGGGPQEDDRSDSVDYMETCLYLDFSLFNSQSKVAQSYHPG